MKIGWIQGFSEQFIENLMIWRKKIERVFLKVFIHFYNLGALNIVNKLSLICDFKLISSETEKILKKN